MTDLTPDEQFFYDHAGWSFDPETETSEEGRRRMAVLLAVDEATRKANGWWVAWREEDFPFDDDVHGPDEYGYWAALYRGSEDGPMLIASLGGVDAEPGDPYRRVIEAELLDMTN